MLRPSSKRMLGASLIAAALLAGCSSSSSNSAPNPFGDSLTRQQYTALRRGEAEQDVVNRMQQSGRPENLVAARYVALFPHHSDAVSCSFWQIAGDSHLLARLCFSSPAGRLTQKLERRA